MTTEGISVAVWGATGGAGAQVVRSCLADARVGRVVAFTRRPLAVGDDRLAEVRCEDFLDLAPQRSHLEGVGAAFFCLGVSATQVKDEDAYRRITKDFAVAAAEALADASPGCCFHFLSGMGADPSGRSRMMWARVKGEAETAVRESGPARVHVWRPAYLHVVGGRERRSLADVAGAVLYPVLWLIPGGANSTVDLAEAMLHVTFEPSEQQLFKSRDIRRIAKAARSGRGG